MLPPFPGLKRSLLSASFMLICMLGLLSCGGNSKVNSTAAVLESGTAKTNPTREHDQRFLVSATEISFHEILIGKLARQRATDQTVKDLATMMEDAHRETKSSIASMAIIKGFTIPSAPAAEAVISYEQLNDKPIEEFDITYCALTLQNHQDAIALFENAARGNLDPDIQSWAATMVPALRAQLMQARACESHLNPVSELIR